MAKILVVDDCEDISSLLEMLLKNEYHDVTTCKNGRCAQQNLKSFNYELVITDVLMPDMDGFELSKFIREELPAPKNKTPIIAMSGGGTMLPSKVALAGIGLHANILLQKPFSANEMKDAVSNILAA